MLSLTLPAPVTLEKHGCGVLRSEGGLHCAFDVAAAQRSSAHGRAGDDQRGTYFSVLDSLRQYGILFSIFSSTDAPPDLCFHLEEANAAGATQDTHAGGI